MDVDLKKLRCDVRCHRAGSVRVDRDGKRPSPDPLSAMRPTSFLIAAAAGLAGADAAQAQSRFLFSIDWQGPTVGTPDPSGIPITEGDILTPTTGSSLPALGPLPTPTIAFAAAPTLGLPGVCVGHPGGTPCIVEVDAFSMGADAYLRPNQPIRDGQLVFSVDEFSLGSGANPYVSVDTEYPVGDAGADTFTNQVPLPPAPLPPGFGFHTYFSDGDGGPSGSGSAYPGVGLIEPNGPLAGMPDTGDNLDALDIAEPLSTFAGGLFYSLDAGYFDPLEGVFNSGSAPANGFSAGDVLTPGAAGFPIVYAPAPALGLDLIAGAQDDLDALILRENGVAGYQPSNNPYDWMGGGSDMLIFSVRRGSAIIGMPDSIFGIPIEEGDLLVPPVVGGVSPFPGIIVAAETLGLATLRSGTGNTGADLNAADSIRGPIMDCDMDGIEDSVAIANGLVPDTNMDGIPDSCGGTTMGPIGTVGCVCTTAVAPCGNAYPAGCINATGIGATLSGFGTLAGGTAASFAADDLVLTTSGMPGPTFALTFMGSTLAGPFPLGNGLLCATGTIVRLGVVPVPASGTSTFGPGLIASSGGFITAGSTWHFQTWFRDVGGPCGSFSNLSNSLSVTFL